LEKTKKKNKEIDVEELLVYAAPVGEIATEINHRKHSTLQSFAPVEKPG